MTTRTIEQLVSRLRGQIESEDHILAKFMERLSSDPCYAFEWGEDAIKASARIFVANRMLAWKNTASIEAIQKEVLQMTMQCSNRPESSSSTISNLTNRYKLMAYAELAFWLDN